jgi:hypothetical protein
MSDVHGEVNLIFFVPGVVLNATIRHMLDGLYELCTLF